MNCSRESIESSIETSSVCGIATVDWWIDAHLASPSDCSLASSTGPVVSSCFARLADSCDLLRCGRNRGRKAAVPGLIDYFSIHETELNRIANLHLGVNWGAVVLFAVNFWLKLSEFEPRCQDDCGIGPHCGEDVRSEIQPLVREPSRFEDRWQGIGNHTTGFFRILRVAGCLQRHDFEWFQPSFLRPISICPYLQSFFPFTLVARPFLLRLAGWGYIHISNSENSLDTFPSLRTQFESQ